MNLLTIATIYIMLDSYNHCIHRTTNKVCIGITSI